MYVQNLTSQRVDAVFSVADLELLKRESTHKNVRAKNSSHAHFDVDTPTFCVLC